ncbi:MAG: hypothetical protein R3B46_11075 [Phycisphaerales bacterium]
MGEDGRVERDAGPEADGAAVLGGDAGGELDECAVAQDGELDIAAFVGADLFDAFDERGERGVADEGEDIALPEALVVAAWLCFADAHDGREAEQVAEWRRLALECCGRGLEVGVGEDHGHGGVAGFVLEGECEGAAAGLFCGAFDGLEEADG